MAYPEHMLPIEQTIIDKILDRALEKGLIVSVYDGEVWTLSRSTDREAITAEVAATDMTTLRFRQTAGALVGDVDLVHGNDEDVVHDHTDNPLMEELCRE